MAYILIKMHHNKVLGKISKMAGDYVTRLEELVRKNNPNWKPGDAFDTQIPCQVV